MKSKRFRIDATWVETPRVDETDVAQISITLDERSLIQIVDVSGSTLRNNLRASAVSLGLWFADNWWRLRWEPIPDYGKAGADWRSCHELTSVSGGTTWPPVMIYGVGERMVISPITMGASKGGPAVYLPIPITLLPAQTYEIGLDTFFRSVIENCARARDGKALKSLVSQLRRERNDSDIAAWRRLEAMLGYDVDKAPECLIKDLSFQEERLGAAAIEEAAASYPGPESSKTLAEVVSASEDSALAINLASAVTESNVEVHIDPWKPIWQAAETAAADFRRGVGHSEGPILNKAFGEILAINWRDVSAAPSTARNLPYGAWLKTEGASEKVALQAKSSAGRRFELARILGDAILRNGAKFGVISHARTDRQKFQRAFAQSLLCPLRDLQKFVDLTGPTDEQIAEAAKRFHVHDNVVRTLLVNKGFLQRETLTDALEAA